jgi:hypothetical protein
MKKRNKKQKTKNSEFSASLWLKTLKRRPENGMARKKRSVFGKKWQNGTVWDSSRQVQNPQRPAVKGVTKNEGEKHAVHRTGRLCARIISGKSINVVILSGSPSNARAEVEGSHALKPVRSFDGFDFAHHRPRSKTRCAQDDSIWNLPGKILTHGRFEQKGLRISREEHFFVQDRAEIADAFAAGAPALNAPAVLCDVDFSKTKWNLHLESPVAMVNGNAKSQFIHTPRCGAAESPAGAAFDCDLLHLDIAGRFVGKFAGCNRQILWIAGVGGDNGSQLVARKHALRDDPRLGRCSTAGREKAKDK